VIVLLGTLVICIPQRKKPKGPFKPFDVPDQYLSLPAVLSVGNAVLGRGVTTGTLRGMQFASRIR
jgi:hypothetical protein